MEEQINEQENKHVIKIKNFEGPFDLLCYLIDKNKMDIFNIKLDDVTEQYIEYMQTMEKLDLDIASEFLVMAATLIYLKSKRLLPMLEPEEEEQISEEDLQKQIIIYKMYKDFSQQLRERYEEFGNRINKSPDNVDLPRQKIEKVYGKEILPVTYYNLIKKNSDLSTLNYENITKLAEYEKVTVRTKAREIIKELMKQPKFIFNKLFTDKQENRLESVTAFLSLLELAKLKRIKIEQEKTFGDITVEKVEKQKNKNRKI